MFADFSAHETSQLSTLFLLSPHTSLLTTDALANEGIERPHFHPSLSQPLTSLCYYHTLFILQYSCPFPAANQFRRLPLTIYRNKHLVYLDAYTQNTQYWSGVGRELFWGQKWLCWLPRGFILSTNRPLQIWIWVQIVADYPTVACNALITLHRIDNEEGHLRRRQTEQSAARATICSDFFEELRISLLALEQSGTISDTMLYTVTCSLNF